MPPTATPEPAPTLEPLPPEPQAIEFQAEDGQVLEGTYYPAGVNPAPLVVLMHWAPGDQKEWTEIAYWLQNRGLGGATPNPAAFPWLDPSWFPEMLDDQPLAVFTFTFRGCEDGCQSFEPEGWLLDAQAAMEVAKELDGVDPMQIVAIGASIGSDGAPDGCLYLSEYCQGALSLSPGSYLTIDYADAVETLGAEQPPIPVWCFYAEGDSAAAAACESASGDHYQLYKYEGMAHGMQLVDPQYEPNVLQLMLDFIELSLDL